MTKKSIPKFRIFNVAVFDPSHIAWPIDHYLNDQDLAIVQAAAIAKKHPEWCVWVKGHKNRRDYDGKIIWEYLPKKDE